MDDLLRALQTVYMYLPVILAILVTIIGIIARVRRFLRMSAEEKKKAIQADRVILLIKQQLLSIVAEAEKGWGSGTGRIKKSWVWDQLAANHKGLMGYIESGIVERSTVDKLIEDAVAELDHMIEHNEDVAAAVVDTSREEGEENDEHHSELCPETDETAGGE